MQNTSPWSIVKTLRLQYDLACRSSETVALLTPSCWLSPAALVAQWRFSAGEGSGKALQPLRRLATANAVKYTARIDEPGSVHWRVMDWSASRGDSLPHESKQQQMVFQWGRPPIFLEWPCCGKGLCLDVRTILCVTIVFQGEGLCALCCLRKGLMHHAV